MPEPAPPPPPSPPPPSPPPPDPNKAIKDETERLKAEAERDKAYAERVKALGLPSFEGKTTLSQGAGAIETLILSAEAVEEAAKQIVALADRKRRVYLVLAGSEAVDFSPVAALEAQIAAFRAIFDEALQPAAKFELAAAGAVAPIAAISTLAGLLRSDVEVSGVELTALNDRVLATAVAGKLAGRAYLPAAGGGTPSDSPLIAALMSLAADRDRVAAAIKALEPPQSERFAAALARYDTFFSSATSPDAKGSIPLIQAARLDQLLKQKPLLLRVHLDKAGGSVVILRNLWTLLGFPSVRVSGGLVASYSLTDPATGLVLAAGVLTCRTRVATLKSIQKGPGTAPPPA